MYGQADLDDHHNEARRFSIRNKAGLTKPSKSTFESRRIFVAIFLLAPLVLLLAWRLF